MLSQIVQPLVQTQIRLLANSQATRSTLVQTIARWLGYLGVQAKVIHLGTNCEHIQITLSVGKPDSCEKNDWLKIIENLDRNSPTTESSRDTYAAIGLSQRTKLQRLLAYLIQIGTPDQNVDWQTIEPQLRSLEFNESMILGIKSALKVPQSLEVLIQGIDPDVAAMALPQAVRIALLDRKINQEENSALTALLESMK